MFSLQLAAMLMVVGLRVYCCFPSKIGRSTINLKSQSRFDEFTTPDLLRASIFKKLDRSLDDFDPIQLRPTQSQSTEAANTGDLTGSGPFRA